MEGERSDEERTGSARIDRFEGDHEFLSGFHPTPGRAKKMGRRVAVRADWDEVKIAVMDELLHAKFAHRQMRELLLKTGDAVLVEGNHWHDPFWGVCTGCKYGCEGIGENHLGRLLMALRTELRN